MRKMMISLFLAGVMGMAFGMTSLAGQWTLEENIWKYRQDDGSRCAGGWYWINGRCYCFDGAGQMYADTVTPDGWQVDASGAWIEDGVVQQCGPSKGIWDQIVSEVDDVDADTFEEQVRRLVNQERDEAHKDYLFWDEDLSAAAEARAREIAESYGHTRPDGRSWVTILDEYNVDCDHWGENIAYGQLDPEEVMNDWMKSESHRDIILDSRFEHIGVGCYLSDNVLYWVQLFTD